MGWYGLSDSEHEIMKYIWKHEEVTLREVVACWRTEAIRGSSRLSIRF